MSWLHVNHCDWVRGDEIGFCVWQKLYSSPQCKLDGKLRVSQVRSELLVLWAVCGDGLV
jgi:hypothetical protein